MKAFLDDPKNSFQHCFVHCPLQSTKKCLETLCASQWNGFFGQACWIQSQRSVRDTRHENVQTHDLKQSRDTLDRDQDKNSMKE